MFVPFPIILLFILTSLSLTGQTKGYQYAWGDFSGFNDTAETDGLTMQGGAHINDEGHIVLEGSTVSFDFGRTPFRPSLGSSKPFSLALTFEAGSFDLSDPSQDFLSNLFTGTFNGDGNPLDMHISYNGSTMASGGFHSDEDFQLTTKIKPGDDLTMIITQTSDNELSLSFYSGQSLVSTVGLNLPNDRASDLESFTVGDAGSNMVLKGLGLVVYDTASPEWLDSYFKEVGVGGSSVPEPSGAFLGLAGAAALLLRRRRVPSPA